MVDGLRMALYRKAATRSMTEELRAVASLPRHSSSCQNYLKQMSHLTEVYCLSILLIVIFKVAFVDPEGDFVLCSREHRRVMVFENEREPLSRPLGKSVIIRAARANKSFLPLLLMREE